MSWLPSEIVICRRCGSFKKRDVICPHCGSGLVGEKVEKEIWDALNKKSVEYDKSIPSLIEEMAICKECNALKKRDTACPNCSGKKWELTQSRAAVRTAVGIVFAIDIIGIVVSILAGGISRYEIGRTSVILVGSIIVDLYLGINLLRGKKWARKWMLIRAVAGLVIFGIIYLLQDNIGSFIIQIGFCGAIILLLTGVSTRVRLAGSVTLFILVLIGGIFDLLLKGEKKRNKKFEKNPQKVLTFSKILRSPSSEKSFTGGAIWLLLAFPQRSRRREGRKRASFVSPYLPIRFCLQAQGSFRSPSKPARA